jgi:hypothetical protein
MVERPAKVALLSVLVVAGCSGGGAGLDGGPLGIGGTGGGGGGAGAGGATGGVPSIDPASFLGTWNETATLGGSGPCSNGMAALEPASETHQITLTVGSSSDLVIAPGTSLPCSIPLNIASRNQATLVRPVQCPIAVANVGTGTFTFSTWTFTVSGTTGTEAASGSAAVLGITCPITFAATLSR